VPNDEVKSLALAAEASVGYKLAEALFPVNVLKIKRGHQPTGEELTWLKQWIAVRDNVRYSAGTTVWNSVGDSVGGSMGYNVWDSVGESVWSSIWDSAWKSAGDSVWSSVGNSVWESVWAYTSSLFPNITKWKYINHAEGENPFQPAINLWKNGLIPSFDGKSWRLHAGENAEVVWEEVIRNEYI
jgi:hypothetical protein